MRLQPGVQQVLSQVSSEAKILDLGCGNGELWRTIKGSGFVGLYIGLDSSAELLHIADPKPVDPMMPSSARFIQADIALMDWDANLPERSFDTIFAFAVLHHIPSHELRIQILRKVRTLLSASGTFIHSEWQFMNSPRLRKRVQPWETIGLSTDHLEPNDYLLDWRQGGYGLRYVHHFDDQELTQIARESSFQISKTFLSDGEKGQLGLYQFWQPE